jgi:aminobenzoyl-glutamate utilization protein B
MEPEPMKLRTVATTATAAVALMFAVPGWAGPVDETQSSQILADVDRQNAELSRTALAIWDYAEVGFQEERSSALLQARLRAAGFTIEAGVAGMPTAFVARYRQGEGGPVIGIMAEFDALPGLSQQAQPAQAAEPDSHAGHGCGHNLFGAASVTAAIATRNWMRANNVTGEIRLYGAPAEEGGSGKVFMVRAGLTADVSAMLHWHPDDENSAAQNTALANVSGKFRFAGVAAHAAGAPERGRSALDGVEALNHMVNMMREHVPQDARIHYVITEGGNAPNVVPASAEVYYYVRHPNQRVVVDIMERVQAAARGAAMGTGTTMSWAQVGGTFDLLPNDTLGRIVDANLRRVGPPVWGETERRFIEQITPTFGPGATIPTSDIEPYSSGAINYGSTDVGDVSYTTPTAGFGVATWAPGTAAHSWQAVAASGSSIGVVGANVAAKVLALSAAELFQSPEAVAAARAELEQRRGADFVYRSLLGDNQPSLNYRRNPGAR